MSLAASNRRTLGRVLRLGGCRTHRTFLGSTRHASAPAASGTVASVASSPPTSDKASNVLVWGRGAFGGLGTGSYQDVRTPTPILAGERVADLAAGWTHSLAVTADGRVFEWGWKPHLRSFLNATKWHMRSPAAFRAMQRLGLGRLTFDGAMKSPVEVVEFGPHALHPAPGQERSDDEYADAAAGEAGKRGKGDALEGSPAIAVQASVGGEQCAVVTSDGRLFTWGGGFYGQLGHGNKAFDTQLAIPDRVKGDLLGERVTAVSCGFQHTLILTADGSAWSMGKAQHGALGIPTAADIKRNTDNRLFRPVNIQRQNATDAPRAEPMGRVAQLAAGFNHSVFLDREGGVWSCGKGATLALGSDSFEDQTAPARVRALLGHRVVKIAAGQHHTVALTDKGRVFTWGVNRHGQCGRSRQDALLNPNVSARGLAVPLKTLPVGEVTFAWEPAAAVPAEVKAARPRGRVVDIFAGFHHTAVITESGECIAFGGHTDGSPAGDMLLDDLAVINPRRLLPSDRASDRVRKVAFGFETTLVALH